LLAIEQQRVSGEARAETLANVFRAAHSLKGAARAVGVTAIEQLAHALEEILRALQSGQLQPAPELFTACYQAIDVLGVVQEAYEKGATVAPLQALRCLAELEALRPTPAGAGPVADAGPAQPAGAMTVPAPADAPVGPAEPQPTVPTAPIAAALPALPPAAAPRTAALPGGAQAADETIRVSVTKLDALMDQLSELQLVKIRAGERLQQVQRLQERLAGLQKDWLTVRGSFNRLARHGLGGEAAAGQHEDLDLLLRHLQDNQDATRAIAALVGDLAYAYSSDVMQISLVIDGMEEEIKHARMLPLHTVTPAFHRMLRDLATASGKEVAFEITGGEVELDKRVLELVKDPLMHLLRNAVDHGIEPGAARLAAGKPACGRICLKAEQIGKDIVIQVSDDGSGLDLDALRSAAIRRSIPGAAGLSDAELADLIFTPGFSSSPIITDVSGRGIGMDVVRRNLDRLRGAIRVDWQPGAGTIFTLSIPVALTSARGLLVRISDQAFAIPLNAIVWIAALPRSQVLPAGGDDTVLYQGRPLPLVYLGDLLRLPQTIDLAGLDPLPVVIISVAERMAALVVDELVDEQEIVIKGLGRQLSRVAGVAGASVLGSGEVILILNPADLLRLGAHPEQRAAFSRRMAAAATAAAPAKPAGPKHILVVDDSITTRTLEKNILEAAGYQVNLAIDGLEAYNMVLIDALPDLVISDVAMPRLDGFGLTRRLKGDERTAHIPVILVTSLESAEDKARGVDSGADAYIVKSSFNQDNLLETIRQLI
ncbi:MAG: hybrid sensor histidine kinase/response regulator, partial [Chloroflexota bacterium]